MCQVVTRVSTLHPRVLTEVRASLLQTATSTIRSQPGLGLDTTKEFGVRCAVRTEEREATREERKEATSPETSET